MKKTAIAELESMGLSHREAGRCWFVYADNPDCGVYISKAGMREAERDGTVRELVVKASMRLPAGASREALVGRPA